MGGGGLRPPDSLRGDPLTSLRPGQKIPPGPCQRLVGIPLQLWKIEPGFQFLMVRGSEEAKKDTKWCPGLRKSVQTDRKLKNFNEFWDKLC